MAGSAVSDFFKGVAGGFFGNDYLRDFKHASKTFRSGLYQNAPKFKFLFHVYFDINSDAFASTSSAVNNFGILVKTIKLPQFSFSTHDMNQYNRKRIVQTKIKYEPIDITFHDDNDNFINALWYRYYTYYYADATEPKVVFAGSKGGQPDNKQYGGGVQGPATGANYAARTQYQPDVPNNWGYIGETSSPSSPNPVKPPFFKNITIFGFSPPAHKFTAYTLINPIITRFGHDTYNYDEGNGIMSNTMTLDYETVVYNQGQYDGSKPENIITGFGNQANYDRQLSPISTPGSNSNFLGPTGLIASAGGAMGQFAGGNILGGIQTAGRVINGIKNTNLVQSLKSEISTSIQNALNNTDGGTRSTLFKLPAYGATPSSQGTAGAPPVAQQGPAIPGAPPTAGTQNNINGFV